MKAALVNDPRFLQMEPATIELIRLDHASQALQAALRPENLEVTVVGDIQLPHGQLADLLLLYFGTLTGGVAADHPSAQHWRNATCSAAHPARQLSIANIPPAKGGRTEKGKGRSEGKDIASGLPGKGPVAGVGGEWEGLMTCPRSVSRITLKDEEERAVVYVLVSTCGFYGQTADGADLSSLTADTRRHVSSSSYDMHVSSSSYDMHVSSLTADTRRLHLTRSFHVLSKVLNNRLHDELREKMGLGYSASFGTVSTVFNF